MRIVVERFKNLQLVDLDVGGLTLLVGGNNAGKSSVLQAIQFGVSVAQTSAMQGGTWVDGRLSTSIGQGDLVYTPIKDVLSLGINGRLREPEPEAIRITYQDGEAETRVSVRKGRNKNILLELLGQPLGALLQSIQSPYSALVTGLAGIPSEEEFETNIVVRKAAAKGDSNSVFRNILLQLKKDQGKWDKFEDQVASIFPGYKVEVAFNSDSDETITCTVNRAGVTYPVDTCGTGVLQTVQIFSYINLFAPKLLLLDEPDSHLHPNNQKQLARQLLKAAKDGQNIVISTHSKHLVEALIEHARLIWLAKGEKQPETPHYEVKALLEIGALNAGERLGNPTHVFLTEDKNQELLKVILEANGFNLEECDVVSYSGCTQIGTAVALISHLKRRHPNSKYVIHRDRDFLGVDALNAYVQKFAAMNVRVLFPIGNDIESYFTSQAHLVAVCGIPADVAQDVRQVVYTARRPALIEKWVNIKIENLKKAGEQINAGQIAAEADAAIFGPDSAAVHGKILLSGIRSELQGRQIAHQLIANSPALADPSLAALLAP